jgi:hypothetical protein
VLKDGSGAMTSQQGIHSTGMFFVLSRALNILVNWWGQHGGTHCLLVCGIFSTSEGSRSKALSIHKVLS